MFILLYIDKTSKYSIDGISLIPETEYIEILNVLKNKKEIIKNLEADKIHLNNEIIILKKELHKEISKRSNNKQSKSNKINKEEQANLSKSNTEEDISDYLDNKNFNKNLPIKKDIEKESNNSVSLNNKQTIINKNNKETNNSLKTSNLDNNAQDAINRLEADQEAFNQIIIALKKEIKDLTKEKNNYKKLYNESISVLDGSKSEIINLMSSTVERLIQEVKITKTVKELFKMLLLAMNYSDNKINELFDSKKRKSMFG